MFGLSGDTLTAAAIFVTQAAIGAIQLWNRNQQARQHAENQVSQAQLRADLVKEIHDIKIWVLESFVRKESK